MEFQKGMRSSRKSPHVWERPLTLSSPLSNLPSPSNTCLQTLACNKVRPSCGKHQQTIFIKYITSKWGWVNPDTQLLNPLSTALHLYDTLKLNWRHQASPPMGKAIHMQQDIKSLVPYLSSGVVDSRTLRHCTLSLNCWQRKLWQRWRRFNTMICGALLACTLWINELSFFL